MTNTFLFNKEFGAKLHEWHESASDPIYQVGSLIAVGKPVEKEQLVACATSLVKTLDTAIVNRRSVKDIEDVIKLLHEIERQVYPQYFKCSNSTNLWRRESSRISDILMRCKGGRNQSAERTHTLLAPAEVMMLLGLAENPPPLKMGGLLSFPAWEMLKKNDEQMIVYGFNPNEVSDRLTIQLREPQPISN